MISTSSLKGNKCICLSLGNEYISSGLQHGEVQVLQEGRITVRVVNLNCVPAVQKSVIVIVICERDVHYGFFFLLFKTLI